MTRGLGDSSTYEDTRDDGASARYGCTMRAEIVSGITADPEVAFGKPVIAGTRVPAALILGQLAAGVAEAELCSEYELSPEQLRAAIRYGAWLAEQDCVRAVS